MTDYPPPPPAQPAWGGQQTYTYSVGGRPPMQSLKGLSVALTILLGAMTLIAIIAAAIRFDRASLIEDSLNSTVPNISDLTDADARVASSAGFYLVGFVAIAVVFIIWQYRHAKNAQALGVTGGLGPGWAIGGWFIPIANYVLPAVQLFQSSKGSSRQRKGAGIVITWAIVFGIGGLLTSIGYFGQETDSEGNFIIETPEDVQDIADADRMAGIGFLVVAVAAVLAIVMVRQLTSRQAESYASMPQPPVPAAPGGWAAPHPPAPPTAPPSAAPGSWGAPPPPSPPPPDGQSGSPPTPPAEPDDGGPAWPAPPG